MMKPSRSSLDLGIILIFCCVMHNVFIVFGCRISEFYCDNGQCVGLDKYCDGIRDCHDGSDETKYCSRCNRTYYGDRQKTYRIEIVKPSTGKLPQLCVLTFVAGGGDLGDIVELSFERFNLGNLKAVQLNNSYIISQCVGSYMQILERNMNMVTSGRWCSPAASATPVYFSESNNVTVMLTISESEKVPFQFVLRFRYISKHESVTRYGQNHAQYHRGEWVPNSVCDRIFQDCDSQPCKIQSPNFPGFYPRNVTCLMHITQRTIPRGKHAFIVLTQSNEDKLSLKANPGIAGMIVGSSDANGSGAKDITFPPERKLMYGNECIHDYLTVYDGSNAIPSASLAKFCYSGALTPIVSSGSEVVVELRTAPFDNLDMHSFELNVEVIFFPENDIGLRMIGQKCEFILDGEDRSSGMIHSLRHLTAPNTSCSYIFRGSRHDIVWLYFVKYFVDGKTTYGGNSNSNGIGRINGHDRATIQGELYDGNPSQMRSEHHDNTILTEFNDNNGPKLCVHARNFPNFVPLRPCRHPSESYLSTGPDLFLRYSFTNRFSIRYLHLEGRYEFVNTYQDGEPGSSNFNSFDCQRIFRSIRRPEGTFSSPRNVFLYGRGGRTSLSCSYTFVGQKTESIRLTFRKLRMGNRKCKSFYDLQSHRHVCLHSGKSESSSENLIKSPLAELMVSEILFNTIEHKVACICQLDQTITIDVMSNLAHVNFTITGMTSLEDFDSFFFEANYEFLNSVHCRSSDHVLAGTSGEVSVSADHRDLRDGPTRIKCPWLLLADLHQFVHLQIMGTTALETCKTNNRIVVFSLDNLEPVSLVCPSDSRNLDGEIAGLENFQNVGEASTISAARGVTDIGLKFMGSQMVQVEVHSISWNKTQFRQHWLQTNTLIVEFHASEPGHFQFKWMRGAKSQATKLLARKSYSEECSYKCHEGGMDDDDNSDCLSSFDLWCNKKSICSERDGDCSSIARFPWIYIGIGVVCGVLVTLILIMSLLHRLRETKSKKGKPFPTEEYSMDGKEIDC